MYTIAVQQVLPEFARLFVASTDAAGAAGPLPDRLKTASENRRREFLAGRHCAAQALRLLGAPDWRSEIGTGTGGEPLWPAGFTGSISHTNVLAMAAVAPVDRAHSIGIDTERVVDPSRAARVSHIVLHACETRLKGKGFDSTIVFTLAFSAKEALFKCLYPLVHRRFEYRDAAVRLIDVPNQAIVIELLTSLGDGYTRGCTFSGQFAVDGTHVTTSFWIANHTG